MSLREKIKSLSGGKVRALDADDREALGALMVTAALALADGKISDKEEEALRGAVENFKRARGNTP